MLKLFTFLPFPLLSVDAYGRYAYYHHPMLKIPYIPPVSVTLRGCVRTVCILPSSHARTTLHSSQYCCYISGHLLPSYHPRLELDGGYVTHPVQDVIIVPLVTGNVRRHCLIWIHVIYEAHRHNVSSSLVTLITAHVPISDIRSNTSGRSRRHNKLEKTKSAYFTMKFW